MYTVVMCGCLSVCIINQSQGEINQTLGSLTFERTTWLRFGSKDYWSEPGDWWKIQTMITFMMNCVNAALQKVIWWKYAWKQMQGMCNVSVRSLLFMQQEMKLNVETMKWTLTFSPCYLAFVAKKHLPSRRSYFCEPLAPKISEIHFLGRDSRLENFYSLNLHETLLVESSLLKINYCFKNVCFFDKMLKVYINTCTGRS